MILIDWDGSGIGPAVIDVGFVLLSVDTGGIIGPVLEPDPTRLDALLDGYQKQHTLSKAEIERLPDAIRFRTLIGACATFARAMRKGRPEEERPRYWRRYLMAGEIAGRARQRFSVNR